ncbi:MAG: UPF0104 family protein [Chloroflexi bacterium]|nr:MAG: UPF0104 family protein [Chloroflexota bacterium]
MQKYRNQIITGLIIVLGMYILILIIFDASGQFDDGDGILDALRQFPLWLVPVLCLTQISAGFFRFLEWHYYLGVIDARDKISLKDSIIIFVSAFTMVVSPGKAAELLKAVFLKMKTGVSIARSAPVVVAERVVDGLAVIVILVITLALASERLDLGEYRDESQTIVFISAALIISGLIVVQIKPLAYFVLNQLIANIPIIKRIHQPLVEFYESSQEIFLLKHVIPTTLMGVGVYLSSTTGFILVMWGLGAEIHIDLMLKIAFIVGVSSAVGALSFVPNGAGVTEFTNYGMLLALVASSDPTITPSVAAAAALMQGFFHKWFRVLVGMGVAFVYRQRLFTTEFQEELALMEAQKSHGV